MTTPASIDEPDAVRRLEAEADVERAEVAALAREREVRAQPDVLDDRGKRPSCALKVAPRSIGSPSPDTLTAIVRPWISTGPRLIWAGTWISRVDVPRK